jgi:S-adenosylmethionine-diacylglycerol 3-amino-3-carboxypropyl transferase
MSGTVTARAEPTGEFVSSARLDLVRYSQVWEDHALLEAGLRVGPGDDVLAIAGAGCNVLALLLAAPRRIVAIDVSPAQTALLELKLSGLRCLSHSDFVAMLGARPCPDRVALYERLAPALPPAARGFWDKHRDDLRAGAIGCGLFDRYVSVAVREQVVERLLDPDAVRRLLALADPSHQLRLFEREIATPAFERAFRATCSREALSGRARDASQFRYVSDQDLGEFFWRRLRYVCTALPARANFYLEWFLTGRYADLETGPPFLRPQAFERLRSLVERVEVVSDNLESYLAEQPPGTFSKAALSDVFEYVSEQATDELLALLASRMRAGGRIAYWNLLVPRASSERLRSRLRPVRREAERLWRRDRCFFYGGFRLEEVRG